MKVVNNAKLKRNLLFCLLNSIETDIRNNILYLQNEGIVINDEIIKKLKQRYFDDKKENTETLDFLINYLDMGDYIQILQANANIFIDKKSLKKLCDEIEKLIPTRNRIMHVRPLEFDDDEKVLNFVRNINNFDGIIKFEETKNEFDKINNNPNYLLSIVPTVYHEKKSNIMNNLPMVDYDDTGFIGRLKDKELLKKKILGPYPVISVIGVGGIGKTSLVLSCLYDMLDDYDETKDFFNSIIWITLKTKGLYDGEFKKIKNAIIDLDENFKAVNENFDDINISSVTDIIDYMKKNKTLLVIDNLETLVRDSEIKKLFEEIPVGSKILITSRVGIGNYEQTFHLEKLSKMDALIYFRKLSNIYKVNSLIKQKDEKLEEYLAHLDSNPLAIKWFVINVGRGMTPDDILNNRITDLTEFCLSNIYEKLSENAKYILRIILIKHNRCGMAELLYLCELSYDECIDSINELFKSNFLQQNEDFSYSILDFAISYIQNVKGFSNYSIDTKIQQAINKLNGSLENLKKDIHLTNEYHPLSLFPKNDNERIATLYMLAAIEASKARDYAKVDKYFTLAKNSANTYSDIYKIAGYLYSKFDSIKSEENYKIAIELAEDKAPVYYFFAGSLINNQKYEMAEIEISKALRINPDNNLIKLRCARLYKMQNKYDESLEILETIDLSSDSDFSNKMQIKYIFETIDTRIRYAESLLKIDNKKVENLIKSTIKFIENSDIALFDFTIYTSMFKLAHLYIRLLYITDYKTDPLINYLFHFHPYILAAKNGHKKEQLFNTDLENLLLKISEEDSKKINDIINYKATIKELNYGYISRLKENGYGFITPISYTYQTIFFHCSQFKGDFRRLRINDKVSFELVVGDKIQAINVNLYTGDNIEEKIELDYISDIE